ncbi:MAG: hypothetical protein JWM80_10 [Cyanobacteria bacterium RYN_339]|nr:hypothetical protein [Cyanobacteria bacterium RYN_339]
MSKTAWRRIAWAAMVMGLAGCSAGEPGPTAGPVAVATTGGEAAVVTPVATPTPTYARVIDRRIHRPAPSPDVPPPPPIAAGEPSFAGLVVGLDGGTEAPLAGAVVRVREGRYAISDGAGRIVLPGSPPADGIYLASCQGYVASAVTGFPAGEPLILHLRSRAEADVPDPLSDAPFPLAGQILGPDGAPMAGVAVVLGDAAGSTAVPVLTGADGRFTLDVFAPAGGVADGTLIAAGPAGQALVTGIVATAGGAALAPATLVPADHRIRLDLDGSAVAGPLNAAVELLGPGGVRLALEPNGGVVAVANLPGARFAFRMDATSGPAASVVRRDDVAIDFGSAESRIVEKLLAPPQVEVPAWPLEGRTLAWPAVPGAGAYRVAVGAPADGGLAWETFANGPTVILQGLPPGLVAPLNVVVSAWDEPGQSLRTVAAAGAPRRLRVLPLGTSFRSSLVRLSVQGPPPALELP